MSSASILLVDDDAIFCSALARSLRARGYDVWIATSYFEAVGRVLSEPPRIALVDLKMPERSGLELIAEIKKVHPAAIVVVLTADHSPESRIEAQRRGASGYLTKPTDTDDVIAALERAAAQS